MSYNTGPKSVSDSLLLCLDASNNKSYSANRFISYGTGLTTANVSFNLNGDGTFQRVAAGTVIGGYTVQTSDVVYSYALGSNGCHYHGNSASIPAGAYVTFGVDYYVTGATTYPIQNTLLVFENYGGNALSANVGGPNTAQNTWCRATLTAGPTAGAGTQAMFLYPGYCGSRLADSGTIYFRNPRAEWRNGDPGTVGFTSMPNLTTWYDLAGINNGTILSGVTYDPSNNGIFVFDGTANASVNLAAASVYLSKNFTLEIWVKSSGLGSGMTRGGLFGISYGLVLHIESNGTLSLYNYNSDNSINQWDVAVNVGSINMFDNVWHHVVAVRNTSNYYIYIDGVQRATGAVSYPTWSGSNVWSGMTAQIGNNPNDAYYRLKGSVGLAKIYNRVLSSTEVAGNYNALKGRFGL